MPTINEVNTTIAQPINNLIAFSVILSLVIVLVVIIAAWKGAPALFRLFKLQAENNQQNAATTAKLTEIAEQNAHQTHLTLQSVEKNTTEMIRQTGAIEKQTGIIAIQGRDLRSYQTLVSDNLNAHTEQISANTANIALLKAAIDALPAQIRVVIEDQIICARFDESINKIREDVNRFIQHQQTIQDKRSTGTLAPVTIEKAP